MLVLVADPVPAGTVALEPVPVPDPVPVGVATAEPVAVAVVLPTPLPGWVGERPPPLETMLVAAVEADNTKVEAELPAVAVAEEDWLLED